MDLLLDIYFGYSAGVCVSCAEPPGCAIRQEDLKEGQHVLLFRDALFYEGVVQAIQPPDM